MVNNDDVYTLSGKGFAVIIVNHENRSGAEQEKKKLESIFKDYLGFDVKCYDNLTGEKMTKKLQKGMLFVIIKR